MQSGPQRLCLGYTECFAGGTECWPQSVDWATLSAVWVAHNLNHTDVWTTQNALRANRMPCGLRNSMRAAENAVGTKQNTVWANYTEFLLGDVPVGLWPLASGL